MVQHGIFANFAPLLADQLEMPFRYPLTHFQGDDLIAGWVGRLTESRDLRGSDFRRLTAPAVANEGNNLGGVLV
jgi:hypothetical protein